MALKPLNKTQRIYFDLLALRDEFNKKIDMLARELADDLPKDLPQENTRRKKIVRPLRA